jgi:hypothetical protein
MFRHAKTWLSAFVLAVFLFATVVPQAEAALLTVASEKCCSPDQQSGDDEDSGDCASACHPDFAEALCEYPYDVVGYALVTPLDHHLAFFLADGVNVRIEKPPRLS